MNTDFSHDDAYMQLQSRLRLERCIFLMTPSIGIFLFLLLPHSKDIHIDWFSLCVSSLAWGAAWQSH